MFYSFFPSFFFLKLGFVANGMLISILACAMCGKNLAGKSAKDQPIVQGQKFNMA